MSNVQPVLCIPRIDNTTTKKYIFDKIKLQTTLGQDLYSPEIEYELQRNVIYKGKVSVTNGAFEFSFVVPKDISLNYGKGKISYYGFADQIDAGGYDDNYVENYFIKNKSSLCLSIILNITFDY